MTTVFLAEYDTRHYSFTAIGATQKSAKDALLRGLRAHGQQLDLPAGWYRDGMTAAEFADEINVTQMHYGLALRDGSPIRL
jgi:hypothetical protein